MSDDDDDNDDGLTAMQRKIVEIEIAADVLRKQLNLEHEDTNMLFKRIGTTMQEWQNERVKVGNEGFSNVAVVGAIMLFMMATWHRFIHDVDPADREEQYNLIRNACNAILADMPYVASIKDIPKEERQHVN